MISINNLTVAFGGFTLLDDINFHISESDRIGLVGKNGAGKSTMLKIICGLQHPTTGKVSVPSGCIIGYLPQIMSHNKGRSVLEETLSVFDESKKREQELEEINRELETRTDYDSDKYSDLIVRINELSDAIAMDRAELPEVQARKTLKGLGFKDNELDRLTETFSQGWNMRIELAKILLRHPNVLLLDEPTNHLDIESIEWLENYLKSAHCAVVVISHDRKFLDTVTNRTVEIMLGHIHDYKVAYSKYLELRAERMEQQRAAFENQQKMIEKTEEFIEKFRYKPTKSNQVQSRIKQLEKLDRIEIDLEDRSRLCVKFPPAPRSGDLVFKATGLTVGYPDTPVREQVTISADHHGESEAGDASMQGAYTRKTATGIGASPAELPRDGMKIIFEEAEIEIKRGEKVALVGRNGEGKTTFIRVVTGELEPVSGMAKLGHNVNIGYYQQNQEDVLDKNKTVFGTLDDIAVGDIRTKLRDLLGAFLFNGEDIDKKVSVLSGGERARLAMAKLMLKPYNLLALDEPTNHMDIKSKDVLKQALQAYDGTLLIVSHDRDFLDGLVNKIYEFRDGHVHEHLGGISDFLYKRQLENMAELDKAAEVEKASKPKDTKEKTKDCAKNFISKEERKLRQQIEKLEDEISAMEGELKTIEDRLIEPGDGDDIMKLSARYSDIKDCIDIRTARWEELMESLSLL